MGAEIDVAVEMKIRTVGEVDSERLRKARDQRATLRRKLRRRADPEYAARIRAYNREYAKRNAERLREKRKAWRAANPDLVKYHDRRRYEMNPVRREYIIRYGRERRARSNPI